MNKNKLKFVIGSVVIVLAVIVLAAINEFPTYEMFLLTVVLAGIIQLVLGAIKAGVIGYYFPSSVIKGMLSGIGIIIILKQIPHALGYDKDPEGDFSYIQTDGQTTFSELFNMVDYVNPAAIIVAVISLGILILWEQKFMKNITKQPSKGLKKLAKKQKNQTLKLYLQLHL